MGVTGVEGIFRRACEETLVVMRGNLEAVLIILEVSCMSCSSWKTVREGWSIRSLFMIHCMIGQ